MNIRIPLRKKMSLAEYGLQQRKVMEQIEQHFIAMNQLIYYQESQEQEIINYDSSIYDRLISYETARIEELRAEERSNFDEYLRAGRMRELTIYVSFWFSVIILLLLS